MTDRKVRFGLTLPNRGVIIGATTMDERLGFTGRADQDPVWVGDSIFAKPRLGAAALLSALAVRTGRAMKLGPACFASTPLGDALLLAYQWSSLDFMSSGRTAALVAPARARRHTIATSLAIPHAVGCV